jgi:hypothetical protein
MAERSVVRLLPWKGPEGKTAHLITDGTRTPLSMLADTIEGQQIETATVIVGLARPMVAEEATLTGAEGSGFLPMRTERREQSEEGAYRESGDGSAGWTCHSRLWER